MPHIEPTPGSSNGVDIALGEEANNVASDSPARLLLIEQTKLLNAQLRLTRWQTFSERTGAILKILTIVAGLFVLIAVGMSVIAAARSREVVVEPFDTPPALNSNGLTPQVVASTVQDGLATIQAANTIAALRRNIDNAWTGNIAVQVPETGVSISDLNKLLRSKLGNDTHVSGSVVRLPNNQISLTVRADGVPSRTFVGNEAGLPGLSIEAAEYVYGLFEPRLFSRYLISQGRYNDAITFSEQAYARAPDAYRSVLAQNWSSALFISGRTSEGIEKGRLSLALDPNNWDMAGNLVAELVTEGREEEAAAIGKSLSTRLEVAPASTKPLDDKAATYNYDEIMHNYSAEVVGQLQSLSVSDSRGTFLNGAAAAILANAEAGRHDWIATRRYLTQVDVHDPASVASYHLLVGEQALEDGDLPYAQIAFQRFNSIYAADSNTRSNTIAGPCKLALVQGLRGNIKAARATLSAFDHFTQCRTYVGDIDEAHGDHEGADRAYLRAITLAPSLPDAYERWGVAKLARGDLTGAETEFRQANARSPGWADPLKGLGDAAAARREWKKASAYYERAHALAPGWKALALAKSWSDGSLASMPWLKRLSSS
jgi:tetratricopeptide (TPR) repeat protein